MGRMTILLLIAVLAAVAAGALVFRSYDAELRQARDAAGRGGRIVNTSAGPIEYTERGGGIPLLSIHGAGGGYDQGLANVADLVGDNFRVIAPSRFGYLGTPVPSDRSVVAQAGYRRLGQPPNQARHHKHERASAINNPPPALRKAKR